MNCVKGSKDCKICKPIKSYWLKEFKEIVRWDALCFAIISYTIVYLFFHWKGVIIWLIYTQMIDYANCGGVFMTDPRKEESKTKCVAGNINCKICDKEGKIIYYD